MRYYSSDFKYLCYNFFMDDKKDVLQETIGQRLARIRKLRGLSQRDLAKNAGIARSIIADYERGKLRLYDKIIIELTNILKISSDELLGIKNNTENYEPSLRLMRRFIKIEKLPENKKKAILKTIDDLIRANS